MNGNVPSPRPAGRWLPWCAAGLILLVFAGTLLLVTWRLRERLRDQLVGREAATLQRITSLQNVATPPTDVPPELADSLDEVGGEFAALAQVERLENAIGALDGVLGARLYDGEGAVITTLPPALTEDRLPAADLATLAAGAKGRFHAALTLDRIFPQEALTAEEARQTLPVLEVLLPLKSPGSRRRVGVLQLLLDGAPLETEFAHLDRTLLVQAGVIFAGGALLIGGALLWSFGRLQRANRLLARRTEDLLRANTELALAARTSAVGAVTAHLLHGLKNPLAGLKSLVSEQANGGAQGDTALWREAAASAQRMQAMIHEVTRVLAESSGNTRYELNVAELVELLLDRVRPLARERHVELLVAPPPPGELDNRRANLILLVLENLLRNAIEATPAGRPVQVEVVRTNGSITCRVRDAGPGIPESRRAGLFQPVRSTKPGGSGIGLAISRQLAGHLHAELSLVETGAQGSVFQLRVPLEAPERPADSTPEPASSSRA